MARRARSFSNQAATAPGAVVVGLVELAEEDEADCAGRRGALFQVALQRHKKGNVYQQKLFNSLKF